MTLSVRVFSGYSSKYGPEALLAALRFHCNVNTADDVSATGIGSLLNEAG